MSFTTLDCRHRPISHPLDVHEVGVLTTVAEIAGTSAEDMDGLRLAPLLSSPDGPGAREIVFTERFDPNPLPEDTAARDARRMYLETLAPQAEDARQRLRLALEACGGRVGSARRDGGAERAPEAPGRLIRHQLPHTYRRRKATQLRLGGLAEGSARSEYRHHVIGDHHL